MNNVKPTAKKTPVNPEKDNVAPLITING